MERGIIDLVYENGDAIYYRLADKLEKEKILKKTLCQKETHEHVEETFDGEQHWLAVWSKESFDRFSKGDAVEFDFSSTRFYKIMYHGKDKLERVRNINVTRLNKILYFELIF